MKITLKIGCSIGTSVHWYIIYAPKISPNENHTQNRLFHWYIGTSVHWYISHPPKIAPNKIHTQNQLVNQTQVF